MVAKKIRYLLEERGRFYYQRKVPKALEHYIGSSRWHIPVGGTFDAAQTAVAKLRTEHDALIAKAKADPTERTRLRREKDELHALRDSRQSAKDLEYRNKVLSGEINDPEEIAVAEYEQNVVELEPFWTRTDEFLKALEWERNKTVETALSAMPANQIFTEAEFVATIQPVRNLVSSEQICQWRNDYVGTAGVKFRAFTGTKMDDAEYFDCLEAHYKGCFGPAETPPTGDDDRLEWDILKLKLERLMARFAPPADRLTAVFEKFIKFNDIKTEAKYRRVFERFVKYAGNLPITQVTPRILRAYRDKLLADELSVASVKAAFTPLKSLFRYALDEEVVDTNPTQSVTFPKDNRPIGEIKHLAFEPVEVCKILDTIDALWLSPFPYLNDERRIAIRHIVRALTFTAARPIELMSLKPEDVTDAAINIRRTKTKSSWRYVPVHPEIADFPAFIQSGGIKCLLTNNQDLVEPVRHNFMRVLRELMVPVIPEPRKTLYSLRGTFQDAMRRAGAPLEVRQAILGHTQGGAIKHYNSGPEFELMKEWVHKSDPRR